MDESDFWEHFPREIFEEGARYQLGTVGDAVEQRVSWCLDEAKTLLGQGHLGPALTVAATALEIMVRFMVVRPFVGAAFLSDEWADLLVDRVINERRAVGDRELLPGLLRHVKLDLTTIKLSTGNLLWPSTLEVLKARNEFVHQADQPEAKTVELALECALTFWSSVVAAVAKALGFTLGTTGRWSEIRTDLSERRFSAWDPFMKKGFTP